MEGGGSDSDDNQQSEIRNVEAAVSINSTSHNLHGHTQAVITLAGGQVHPNLLASGSKDFTARLWDIEAQKCVSELRGHVGAVRSCCFSPDERILFTAGDTCVGIWDRASAKRVSHLRGHQGFTTSVDVGMKRVEDVTDGVMLLSSSYDGSSKVWDLRVQLPVRTCIGHLRPVSSSVFSSDMKAVYSAGYDSLVRVFNVVTVTSVPPFSIPNPPAAARSLRALKCSRAPLTRCRLSSDGAWLATCSTDAAVGVTKLGPDTTTLLLGHEEGVAVWDCSWGRTEADSSLLATSGGSEVLLWDTLGLQLAYERSELRSSTGPLRGTASRTGSAESAQGAARSGSSQSEGHVGLARQTSSGARAERVQCLLRLSGAGLRSRRWGNDGERIWGCCLRGEGVYAGADDGSIAYWEFPAEVREEMLQD